MNFILISLYLFNFINQISIEFILHQFFCLSFRTISYNLLIKVQYEIPVKTPDYFWINLISGSILLQFNLPVIQFWSTYIYKKYWHVSLLLTVVIILSNFIFIVPNFSSHTNHKQMQLTLCLIILNYIYGMVYGWNTRKQTGLKLKYQISMIYFHFLLSYCKTVDYWEDITYNNSMSRFNDITANR